MRKVLLLPLVLFASLCNAIDYWSISPTEWSYTDGGADCGCSPGNLANGDNVYVKHFISSAVMTLSGNPTVTIYSGGRWDLTGGPMTIDAGTWDIRFNGCLKVSGGDLTLENTVNSFTVNGKIEVTGDITNNGVINGGGNISYTGTLFNNGTVNPLTLLPVELVEFKVANTMDGVYLGWTTASEVNSEYFLVERSVNGLDFYPLGTLDAKGFSECLSVYSFKDEAPIDGVAYYKLTEFDRDGRYMVSQVISTEFHPAISTEAYPNPASDNCVVHYDARETGACILSIKNSRGVQLSESFYAAVKGENSFLVSLSEYSEGIYLVMITDSNFHQSSLKLHKK
ncbi:MAG: T9SS type A sorting domain-containing protein [Flavobacteriales bacterium]